MENKKDLAEQVYLSKVKELLGAVEKKGTVLEELFYVNGVHVATTVTKK